MYTHFKNAFSSWGSAPYGTKNIDFILSPPLVPSLNVELTRAELRRQCQRLHESGAVHVDWTREAEEAVPISALKGLYLQSLMERFPKAKIRRRDASASLQLSSV